MIFCKELDKEFDSNKDMFKALKANKQDIISFKKAQILKSSDKNQGINVRKLDISKFKDTVKGFKLDDSKHYLVVNSTKVLDSHRDLHRNGLWNKTTKEQQGKNYLVLDHKLELSSVVVGKRDIEMVLMDVPFSAIGKNYAGNTQVLVYVFDKDKVISEIAKDWLENKAEDLEASVRMQYVKITFAINAPDEEYYEEEYKEWLANIDLIANKEEYEEMYGEITYFWVIYEAKNVGESSLVLFGSNSSTGILEEKENKFQPSIDTDNNIENDESSDDTQKDEEEFNGWFKKKEEPIDFVKWMINGN